MSDEGTLESVDLRFLSGATGEEDMTLHGVVGRERISRLFAFDLLLSRAKGPLTPDEIDGLLRAPCAITLGPNPGDVVHGILESIDVLDQARTVASRYLARLVPSVWLLSMNKASRVYQNTSIPDLVRTILQAYRMKEGKQFNILVNRAAKSPVREYVVQYQESDWDFIQRWLEAEGFFYWFRHDAEGETLIIADENDDASEIEAPSTIPYRERNNLSTGGIATVWDWTLHQKRVAARVALLDYNYRRPDVPLAVAATVDDKGFGTASVYGDHFKDNETGTAIAALRAERLFCEKRVFSGTTDCARFRVGHTFVLDAHHDEANDGKYLITGIDHRVGQPFDSLGEAPQRYSASFEAIPSTVTYRPERITPWPRIYGIINAHVDGESDGNYAELDDDGRYKLRMPYDMALNKGGTASRWVRMAQPYSGAGYGMHHPLHKGAEVMLAHIDGDPDRPVIVGAAPNAHTPSPVVRANASQSVVQTASGIRVELEDLQS